MFFKTTCIAVALLSASNAYACWEGRAQSVMLVENAFTLCEDITTSIDHLVNKLLESKSTDSNVANPLISDYWDEWAIASTPEAPLLTQNIQGNAIGLGLWLPQEIADNDDLDYLQWIENQGVMLSIGLGNKKSNEPRMRIDYQWHDKFEDSVHVQVEFPIR